MIETEFNDLVEETLAVIEDAIDDCGADIDCELVGGVLTLTCEDGSAIIFSRQVATQELWLAARSGGFHFAYKPDTNDWVCTKGGRRLWDMFAEISLQQAGEAIQLA